jgi:hypothetical protein
MPFPEVIRKWAKRISDNKCQTFVYSEKKGYQICGSEKDLQVDHLDPEGFVLTNGGDPNNDSTPYVRCKNHHIGPGLTRDDGETRIASYGERNWSRHADVGIARLKRREGDKDAIERTLKAHEERRQRGVRYWNSDEGVDQFEKEHMDDLIHKAALNGDTRPRTRQHKRTQRRGHWYDDV